MKESWGTWTFQDNPMQSPGRAPARSVAGIGNFPGFPAAENRHSNRKTPDSEEGKLHGPIIRGLLCRKVTFSRARGFGPRRGPGRWAGEQHRVNKVKSQLKRILSLMKIVMNLSIMAFITNGKVLIYSFTLTSRQTREFPAANGIGDGNKGAPGKRRAGKRINFGNVPGNYRNIVNIPSESLRNFLLRQQNRRSNFSHAETELFSTSRLPRN